MNELIVYVALGFMGLLSLIGFAALLALIVIAMMTCIKGYKGRMAIFADLQSEHCKALKEHKRQNLVKLLKKECEVDDALTIKKIKRYAERKLGTTETTDEPSENA